MLHRFINKGFLLSLLHCVCKLLPLQTCWWCFLICEKLRDISAAWPSDTLMLCSALLKLHGGRADYRHSSFHLFILLQRFVLSGSWSGRITILYRKGLKRNLKLSQLAVSKGALFFCGLIPSSSFHCLTINITPPLPKAHTVLWFNQDLLPKDPEALGNKLDFWNTIFF